MNIRTDDVKGDDRMTFTEWYKNTQGEEWNEDFALVYSVAEEVTSQYENYCKDNNIKPIWDG